MGMNKPKQPDIWITSDTHWNHKNIVKGVSNWEDTSDCRDFPNLEEYNYTIIEGINSVVGQDDELWHLGDWSFGGIDSIWNFRKQIYCKNIHLILGNHDHHIERNRTLPNCRFNRVYQETEDEKLIPIRYDAINAQELFSSVQHVKSTKFFGHRVFMSHYAHRIWNHSHKGVIHLYGHSHDTLTGKWGKSMDVGLESAYRILGQYRPFKWQEIQSIMANRDIKYADHHQPNTN